jgi:hypothetical protein
MKVVINHGWGGYSLSAAAVKRLAELNGRECYFFRLDHKADSYSPILADGTATELLWTAFSIPNPDEIIGPSFRDPEGLYKTYNELYSQYNLTSRPEDRTDPKLIQVIEELGDRANGRCAKLKIVEIPDGTDYEIDDYDGMESIHETHQSWS